MMLAMNRAPQSAETPVSREYLDAALRRIASGARVWWLPLSRQWVVIKPGMPPVNCATPEAARRAYLRVAK